MKNRFMFLSVMFLLLTFLGTSQVYAYSISYDGGEATLVLWGDETSQSEIDDAIAETLGSAVELYKQDVGGAETGALADSYTTTFSNTEEDPSDALIEWEAGTSYIDGKVYLLVKDGNQSPAWYLFVLTGWDGMEDLVLEDFWPGNGAISHVTLYGTSASVPEPATMLLFGTGLIGLGAVGRKRFKKNK